jgi:cyanophycin synthetase
MTPIADIRLLRITYLRGPNVWTYRPALETWLDLGALEDLPTDRLPGFSDRLVALLPALVEHHCGVGERGGFLERLQSGTWAGHVLEHVVIELLNLAGMPTGFGQTRSTSTPGVYRMVFRARDEQVARTALAAGHRLLMSVINALPVDAAAVAAAVGQVREKIDDCYFGPSTASIVAAATERGIPHLRLNAGNLVQLGHGARQRRIWTAETEFTSAIAEGIASDKDLTKTLLKACGVPVPEGEVVASAAAAWAAAEVIGLPVAVKPTDGNHGRGVTLDLMTRADIEAAYAVAERHGSDVIVERYIRGHEHRLLVVGGKVVAAARGEAAWVVGDGVSTLVELTDAQINSDPRRGSTEDHPLGRIDVAADGAVGLDLQRQGLAPHDVPATGRRVLIQRNGNVAIDCTDEVHAEVAHQVALAARVVGLDIAGVDVVTEDISKPLHAQGGAVVEVNAGPGLLMHLRPAVGLPRPVGKAIVDHLFPETEEGAVQPHNGRIEIVGIAGSQGTQHIARLVAWLLHLSGRRVGVACRDGVFLGNRRIDANHGACFTAGHRLLLNRAVDAVVIENGAVSILNDGLAYDRCHVGVVTDVGVSERDRAGLALHDVQQSDQLTKVLRTQVDVVMASGVAVLNATDARVADMASLCDGAVVMYVCDRHADGAGNDALAAHRASGGRTVFARGGWAVLDTAGVELRCANVAYASRRFAAAGASAGTFADTDAQPIEVLLAAVATAWALGISPELISAGIETFVLKPR